MDKYTLKDSLFWTSFKKQKQKYYFCFCFLK